MFCYQEKRRSFLLQKLQALENVQGFEITNHGQSFRGKDLDLFHELFEEEMCEVLNNWCVTRRNYFWKLLNFNRY